MAVTPRKRSGYRVYCDESNTDSHKPHPVYGAILVALDDIRKVQQELADWRRREEMLGELKWEKVRGGLQAADVLMGAVGFHNQDFHLRPNADKDKVELARYIAARLGLRDLKHETNPIKEDLKIVRWHWSGPRPRYRRRAADNPRHVSRGRTPDE